MIDLRIAGVRIAALVLIAVSIYFLLAAAGVNPYPHFASNIADAFTGGGTLFLGLVLLTWRTS